MSELTTYVHVGGMTCSSCTSSVTSALTDLKGVTQADVSLMTEEAVIKHTSVIKPQQLVDAIEDTGFEATINKSTTTNATMENFGNNHGNNNDCEPLYRTSIAIGGMTCSACVNSITNMISEIEGVSKVDVSLMTQDAIVIHYKKVTVNELKETIEDCGFDATINKTEPLSQKKTEPNSSDDLAITRVTLKILGMTCSSCCNSIEGSISRLDGVESCTVALSTEEAVITYDQAKIGIRRLIESIEDCGFDAIVNNNLDNSSQLELLSKTKEVQFWRSNFMKLLLFGIPVFFLGHVLPAIKSTFNIQRKEIKIMHGIYLEIIIQFILASYIQFTLGKRFYVNSYKALKHRSGTMDLLICVSTTIVYIYSCVSMAQCVLSEKEYVPNVLFATSAMLFIFVTLGKWVESKAKGNTSSALSKLLSLAPSSCIIIENSEGLKDEQDFNVSNLVQKTIGIDLLQKNDIALILPGAKIPTDGVCIFGRSEVDESLLTGESMPILKHKGSQLIGGSVNVAAPLYMRVEKLGENTQLQQIVNLVKGAQITKAPVQRYADTIASKFVVFILMLSTFTLLMWSLYIMCNDASNIPRFFIDKDTNRVQNSKILQVAISVVVVACPCALGLAAPTAVMVGTGVGASNGILIKGGDILERANDIDCIVFDKTGTITSGKMRLTNYQLLNCNELQVWSILHAIEDNSEHPVARAISKGAAEMIGSNEPISIEIEQLDVHVGSGITARLRDTTNVADHIVRIGTAKLIEDCNISNYSDFAACLKNSNQSKISSVSHIVIDDKYVGFVELSDTLKTDAKQTIQALTSLGYTVAMVTGDNARTSKHVAKLVDLPLGNVFAEAKPNDKLSVVKLLQAHGLNVAFVGDGINDAPALVQADLGMAIATGTDIAIEAADIVLLSSYNEADEQLESTMTAISSSDDSVMLNDEKLSRSGMSAVLAALDISKRTFSSIKLNFVLAIVYNLVMLPIAMGLLIIPFGVTMHPMFASAAMACSSTSVILNSLRLKKWRLPQLNDRDLPDPSIDVSEFDVESSIGGREVTDLNLSGFQVNYFAVDKKRPLVSKLLLNLNRKFFGNSYRSQQQTGGSYEMISRS